MESSIAITENLTNELAAERSISVSRDAPKFRRARMGSVSHASYEVHVREMAAFGSETAEIQHILPAT